MSLPVSSPGASVALKASTATTAPTADCVTVQEGQGAPPEDSLPASPLLRNPSFFALQGLRPADLADPASAHPALRQALELVEAPPIDFYRLWLAPELETGCAWFETGHEALARAQLDSLRRLCRLLDLQRGHMVLDAGGGHGAFARLAAREFGASVLCLAPTVAALEHASNRLRAERLQSRLRVELLAGFRPPAEGFDRIVSTNLLTATDSPFAVDVMAATLRPGGRFIGHFVLSTPDKQSSRTRDEGEVESADCCLSALSLPSTTRAERQLCSAGLVTAERRSLRLHLGITLQHWHRNLEDHLPQARHLLPPAVLADWRAQLAAAVKALRLGELQLQEVVASKR